MNTTFHQNWPRYRMLAEHLPIEQRRILKQIYEQRYSIEQIAQHQRISCDKARALEQAAESALVKAALDKIAEGPRGAAWLRLTR